MKKKVKTVSTRTKTKDVQEASGDGLVVAVVGDTHSGGLTALCPPKIGLDDGGYYGASLAQEQLWAWWLDFWKTVQNFAEGRRIVVIHMGDIIDGRVGKQFGPQALSNLTDQENCAIEVMSVPRKLADKLFIIRGTPAHVGENGDAEIHIARELGADAVPYFLSLNVAGIGLIEACHHTRSGQNLWLSSIGAVVARTYVKAVELGKPAPRYIFRAHTHRIDDTGHRFNACRGVTTPAWQLKTSFAHKVASEGISHIGGVYFDENSFHLQRYSPEIGEPETIVVR